MHPTFKQVPPNFGYFSIIAVFNPNCAQRIAATYPPGPEPITVTSYLVCDLQLTFWIHNNEVPKSFEETLKKKGLRLPGKCVSPLQHGYMPDLDCTAELKADGVRWYQELIGSLRWAVPGVDGQAGDGHLGDDGCQRDEEAVTLSPPRL